MEEKPTTISDIDKLYLELLKANKRALIAEAKEAILKSEKADLENKLVAHKLFLKYNLTELDKIDESGNIIYGEKNES